MRSRVAEKLEAEEREHPIDLSAEARVQWMLEMGEQQLQTFMAANGLDCNGAMRRVEHVRQRGRRRSRCMEEVIDASRPDRTQQAG